MQVFNTPVKGSTSILKIHRQPAGDKLMFSPRSAFVYFGVLLLGSVSTQAQLCLVNDTPDTLDLNLSLKGAH